MAIAPRQCILTHEPISQAISEQPKYYCDEASSLFILFGPMRLFFNLLQWKLASREPILPQGKGSGKNGESPDGPSKNLVPEPLPAMAEPNAEGNYFEDDNVTDN
ncbi:hypothetical protein TNCV_674331 [Trichonephila clavipes]|nr:hypothetical protein TNCV_674331 [Trichonephila clavipes]